MKFDPAEIKKKARENFEKAWIETAEMIPKKSKKRYLGGKGILHPVQDLIQEIRKIFLELGFQEIENPLFIPEEEIYLQYGPEAPVILDRCYYLGGLPRPDIGLSDEKVEAIKSIASIDIKKFKEILRNYREGSIEGDDLFETLVIKLGIKENEAARIIELFPEFKSLKPVAEKTTLRSHMTASWFSTLEKMQDQKELPLLLFSIGLRFRREQKIDATHLRAHYGASAIVMDPDISLEAGKEISKKILEKLKFSDIRFVKKKATSNYYAPGTELEVFSRDIEIADCGMYSPVALANYSIRYPVFNIGFGLERILMLREKKEDIREILYPQFYQSLELSDKEIAEQISIERSPETEDGKKLSRLIESIARKNSDEESPCEFSVYKGKFLEKEIEVKILEKESNRKLLGPAALNEIYVHNGNVYGIPSKGKFKEDLDEIKKNGVKAEFSCLDAISSFLAAGIEKAVKEDQAKGEIQIKMAKTPGELNIKIGNTARRYITAKQKRLFLKGPIFTGVEFLVSG